MRGNEPAQRMLFQYSNASAGRIVLFAFPHEGKKNSIMRLGAINRLGIESN
jgi:hypothetical protein